MLRALAEKIISWPEERTTSTNVADLHCQTLHQSTNPPIHQSINPSIHQSINPSIHQSINPPTPSSDHSKAAFSKLFQPHQT
jgi:hypothetical protein